MIRTCKKCGMGKPIELFQLNRGRHTSQCKACAAAAAREWRTSNPVRSSETARKYYCANRAKHAERMRRWRDANKKHKSEIDKAYRESNRDELAAGQRAWRENNKDRIAFSHRKHYEANRHDYIARAIINRSNEKSMPHWLSDGYKADMARTYAHAKECEMLTGDVYHVDHIVPLTGDNVCGLHVPWNLQVLPSDINIRKKNRFEGWSS